jgi:hypothetical protein
LEKGFQIGLRLTCRWRGLAGQQRSLDFGSSFHLRKGCDAQGKAHRVSSRDLLSVCQVPFILNPEAKGNIFRVEAALQMHQYVNNFAWNVRASPFAVLSALIPLMLFSRSTSFS